MKNRNNKPSPQNKGKVFNLLHKLNKLNTIIIAGMDIKLAGIEHTQDISDLFTPFDIEGHKFPEKAGELIHERSVYVALDGERVVGAMAMNLADSSYEIIAMASRQKGAGTALVEFTIDKCKKEKIPKLWGWSLARYNASGFYKRFGSIQVDECYLMRKQWFGEDCYFLGKIIELE